MKNSKKSWIFKGLIVFSVILVAFAYNSYNKTKVDYSPFAMSAEDLEINVVEPSAIMEGTPDGDLMVAIPEGSSLFAKGGLNYIILDEGPDKVYYSMCSTKIVDNKVNVIEGFDPKHDKLIIFCAHNVLSLKDINIIHDTVEDESVTYVEIQGKHSKTSIALLGDIDIKPEDIVLNEKWSKK